MFAFIHAEKAKLPKTLLCSALLDPGGVSQRLLCVASPPTKAH
jgi:hypothetical protein